MTSQLDHKIALGYLVFCFQKITGVNHKTRKSGRAYYWRVHDFKAAEVERHSIPEVVVAAPGNVEHFF